MSPYIKKERRKELDSKLWKIIMELKLSDNDGEVNYTITKILDNVYNRNPNYAKFNRAMGVLSCVSREFYRRVVAPYEDKKIDENGDVYGR